MSLIKINYNLSLNSTRPVITVIDLSQFLLLQNTVNALLTPPLRLKIWNNPPIPPPRKNEVQYSVSRDLYGTFNEWDIRNST